MALVLTEELAVNDVVQVIPRPGQVDDFWDGQFVVITELKSFGIQGYVKMERGFAFIRLNRDAFVKIGRAQYIRDPNDDSDA